jgi:hypothetical protein
VIALSTANESDTALPGSMAHGSVISTPASPRRSVHARDAEAIPLDRGPLALLRALTPTSMPSPSVRSASAGCPPYAMIAGRAQRPMAAYPNLSLLRSRRWRTVFRTPTSTQTPPV